MNRSYLQCNQQTNLALDSLSSYCSPLLALARWMVMTLIIGGRKRGFKDIMGLCVDIKGIIWGHARFSHAGKKLLRNRVFDHPVNQPDPIRDALGVGNVGSATRDLRITNKVPNDVSGKQMAKAGKTIQSRGTKQKFVRRKRVKRANEQSSSLIELKSS